MIAPAVITGDKPRPIDTPIKATPIVAAVVQELPMAKDTIQQRIQLAA